MEDEEPQPHARAPKPNRETTARTWKLPPTQWEPSRRSDLWPRCSQSYSHRCRRRYRESIRIRVRHSNTRVFRCSVRTRWPPFDCVLMLPRKAYTTYVYAIALSRARGRIPDTRYCRVLLLLAPRMTRLLHLQCIPACLLCPGCLGLVCHVTGSFAVMDTKLYPGDIWFAENQHLPTAETNLYIFFFMRAKISNSQILEWLTFRI